MSARNDVAIHHHRLIHIGGPGIGDVVLDAYIPGDSLALNQPGAKFCVQYSGHDWNNLNEPNGRQFPQEVAFRDMIFL